MYLWVVWARELILRCSVGPAMIKGDLTSRLAARYIHSSRAWQISEKTPKVMRDHKRVFVGHNSFDLMTNQARIASI